MQDREKRIFECTYVDSAPAPASFNKFDLFDRDERRSDSAARLGRRGASMSAADGLLDDSLLEPPLSTTYMVFALRKTLVTILSISRRRRGLLWKRVEGRSPISWKGTASAVLLEAGPVCPNG